MRYEHQTKPINQQITEQSTKDKKSDIAKK